MAGTWRPPARRSRSIQPKPKAEATPVRCIDERTGRREVVDRCRRRADAHRADALDGVGIDVRVRNERPVLVLRARPRWGTARERTGATSSSSRDSAPFGSTTGRGPRRRPARHSGCQTISWTSCTITRRRGRRSPPRRGDDAHWASTGQEWAARVYAAGTSSPSAGREIRHARCRAELRSPPPMIAGRFAWKTAISNVEVSRVARLSPLTRHGGRAAPLRRRVNPCEDGRRRREPGNHAQRRTEVAISRGVARKTGAARARAGIHRLTVEGARIADVRRAGPRACAPQRVSTCPRAHRARREIRFMRQEHLQVYRVAPMGRGDEGAASIRPPTRSRRSPGQAEDAAIAWRQRDADQRPMAVRSSQARLVDVPTCDRSSSLGFVRDGSRLLTSSLRGPAGGRPASGRRAPSTHQGQQPGQAGLPGEPFGLGDVVRPRRGPGRRAHDGRRSGRSIAEWPASSARATLGGVRRPAAARCAAPDRTASPGDPGAALGFSSSAVGTPAELEPTPDPSCSDCSALRAEQFALLVGPPACRGLISSRLTTVRSPQRSMLRSACTSVQDPDRSTARDHQTVSAEPRADTAISDVDGQGGDHHGRGRPTALHATSWSTEPAVARRRRHRRDPISA